MCAAQRREENSSYCSSALKLGRSYPETMLSSFVVQWEGWGNPTPQGPLLADKYSPEVHLYSFPLHQPRENSAGPLVKPRLSTPSPTTDERGSTWSEVTGCMGHLLNPMLQESLQSHWEMSQPSTTRNSNWAPCGAGKPWGKWDLDSNDPKRNGTGRDRYHRQ